MNTYIRAVRALLWSCLCLQLAFYLLAWSSALPAGFFVQMSAKGIEAEAMRMLPPGPRLAGALIELPALLALGYGLWQLERLLLGCRDGAMFALATIGHLRAFAGATLVATLLSIVAVPLRTLAYRAGFGMSDARFALGVSSEELMLMLVCALFYLVTHMMHEGRRLSEENEGFV